MLKDRIRSACIVLASLFTLLFLDAVIHTSFFSGALLAIALVGGLWEVSEMARKRKVYMHFAAAAAFLLLWIAMQPYGMSTNAAGVLLFIFFAVVGILQVQRLGVVDEDAISPIGATLLGFAYCGLAGSFLYKIRLLGVDGSSQQVEGIRNLLYFVLVVKSTDIGAYFTGREFGATKLIEKLSPGKTVEGLIGGVCCAMMIAVVLNWVLSIGSLSFFGALLFGFVMALLGQAADLFESLLKRTSGVKDSGSTIPGMGGVLDVIDSLLLTAPVAYWMLLALAS